MVLINLAAAPEGPDAFRDYMMMLLRPGSTSWPATDTPSSVTINQSAAQNTVTSNCHLLFETNLVVVYKESYVIITCGFN